MKVTIPNVKQQISDGNGYITKSHFDFLRTLWERTGGNQDLVEDSQDDISSAELLTFRNRLEDLTKRVEDLEKQINSLGL